MFQPTLTIDKNEEIEIDNFTQNVTQNIQKNNNKEFINLTFEEALSVLYAIHSKYINGKKKNYFLK